MRTFSYLLFVFLIYTSCSPANSNANKGESPLTDTLNAGLAAEPEDYVLILPKDTIDFKSKDGKFQFTIEQIGDTTEFTKLYARHYKKQAEPFKIISVDSIRDALNARVEMKQLDSEFAFVSKIHATNGKEILLNQEIDEICVIAYYPEYDFLFMEGGHSCEEGYDLTTGEHIYEAGTPADQTLSPSGEYRISGVYGGQECSGYIIQKKVDGRYSKIADLEHDDLCYFIKCFWLNDTTFYYSLRTAKYDSVNGTMQYFKMTIKEKQ